MCAAFKEEFSWRRFSLGWFHKTEAFCEAQWRWHRLVFVVFRFLLSAYSLFAFIHMAVNLDVPGSHPNFMAYLTNWTYLVETLFFFWGAAIAFCFCFWPQSFNCRSAGQAQVLPLRDKFEKSGTVNPAYEDDKALGKHGADNPTYEGDKALGGKHTSYGASQQEQPSPPHGDSGAELGPMVSLSWYVQVYWFLGNISQVMALVVTVIYFGALYSSSSQGATLLNINVHGINSVMIVMDVIVSARPVRLMHALYPILYGIVYVIFSAIYWSQDHVNNVLYPGMLDWNHPGPTCGVVAGLGVVVIPLLQLLHYGAYRLRLYCYFRIYGESYL